MASVDFLAVFSRLQLQNLKIHRAHCVVSRNRNASCRKCVDSCPSSAISFEETGLSIDGAECIGCGVCSTVCTAGVFEKQNPDDASLFKQASLASNSLGGHVVFACSPLVHEVEELVDFNLFTEVHCLGELDESLLAMLAAQGAKHITLVKGKCSECALAKGIDTATAVCDTTKTLFNAWNCSTPIEISDRLPGAIRKNHSGGYDASRRSFFSQVRDDMRNAAGVTIDYALDVERNRAEINPNVEYIRVGTDGTLPYNVPGRRVRLLQALNMLGSSDENLVDTRLFGYAVVNQAACSSCYMCTVFCPTGALSKYIKSGSVKGLYFSPAKCIQCGCCEDICPEKAIVVEHQVFANDIAERVKERYCLDAPEISVGTNPHQIVEKVKKLFGTSEVYEK